MPIESAPNKTSPAVAGELFIKLAKNLFSFLLKLLANILFSKEDNVFKLVELGRCKS